MDSEQVIDFLASTSPMVRAQVRNVSEYGKALCKLNLSIQYEKGQHNRQQEIKNYIYNYSKLYGEKINHEEHNNNNLMSSLHQKAESLMAIIQVTSNLRAQSVDKLEVIRAADKLEMSISTAIENDLYNAVKKIDKKAYEQESIASINEKLTEITNLLNLDKSEYRYSANNLSNGHNTNSNYVNNERINTQKLESNFHNPIKVATPIMLKNNFNNVQSESLKTHNDTSYYNNNLIQEMDLNQSLANSYINTPCNIDSNSNYKHAQNNYTSKDCTKNISNFDCFANTNEFTNTSSDNKPVDYNSSSNYKEHMQLHNSNKTSNQNLYQYNFDAMQRNKHYTSDYVTHDNCTTENSANLNSHNSQYNDNYNYGNDLPITYNLSTIDENKGELTQKSNDITNYASLAIEQSANLDHVQKLNVSRNISALVQGRIMNSKKISKTPFQFKAK